MNKISGIYKITNIETNECYIGSSIDINRRCAQHKCFSTWKKCPNKKLYIDFQQYSLDKFSFEILEETNNLKEREQYYIDLLEPVYNNIRAKGIDIERLERRKENHKEYMKEYNKKYKQSEKGKETNRKSQKKYYSQLCIYNGKELTLKALSLRFSRAGIEHPTTEAKKYLLNQ